jgi:NAD(P)-dependent dehydrogenase (short-subunit alcohol dehydrogenase family)
MAARRAFDGRVAFVTGAGGGMGGRIAADLSQAGARVFAVDVKEPPAAGPDGSAGECTYWRFDVTDETRVAAALGEVFASCGRLDYVVNAAGIGWFDRDGSVASIGRDVWERVLDVNLTAAMLVCRHALPLLGRGGAFVHLASVAGLRTSDDPMDAYQVSKAGLISLSRALALQYGPRGIRSNTICPGAILTPMIQPLYDEDPARAERMASRTPLRRIGTVADVSAACQFLLSDEAAFITGTDLVVDGGWTLALA